MEAESGGREESIMIGAVGGAFFEAQEAAAGNVAAAAHKVVSLGSQACRKDELPSCCFRI